MHGKNSGVNISTLAHLRSKYQTEAFPENSGAGEPVIKDLDFAEYQYYGKVNTSWDTVVPKEMTMMAFKKPSGVITGKQFYGLPLTRFLHEEVATNMQFQANFNRITVDSAEMTTVEVKRGFESPIENYKEHLSSILIDFNQVAIPTMYGFSNVYNFNDYVKYLKIYFQENMINFPLTLTGWVKSGLNSIFGTGIALSIVDLGFGDDSPKTTFVRKEQFSFYQKLLMNKGFSIVKNHPWTMVIDLGSPALNQYPGMFTGVKQFFMSNYYLTKDIESTIIKDMIINYYNKFVYNYSYDKIINLTCNNRVKTRARYRSPINYAIFEDWLDLYVNMRNIEEGEYFSKKGLENILRTAKKMPGALDNLQTIGYINNRFKPKMYTSPWGANDLLRREKIRKEKEQQKKLSASLTNGGQSGGY